MGGTIIQYKTICYSTALQNVMYYSTLHCYTTDGYILYQSIPEYDVMQYDMAQHNIIQQYCTLHYITSEY
eukprot:273890-Pyramimonas_sp.AAC.1